MSLTVCNVHLTPNSEKILYVSNSLLKQLKLAGKRSVRLRLGKTIIPASVRPIQKPGKHLYVTAGLRSAVRVPKSGSVFLLNEAEGDIHIGPLIGIMSDGTSRSSSAPSAAVQDLLDRSFALAIRRHTCSHLLPATLIGITIRCLAIFLVLREAG